MRANGTTPATSIAANYLCAFRTKDGKIAEVWMNGTSTTTPAAETKK
jgi:hypothetical protein